MVGLYFFDFYTEALQTATSSDVVQPIIIKMMRRRRDDYGSERTQYFKVCVQAQNPKPILLQTDWEYPP